MERKPNNALDAFFQQIADILNGAERSFLDLLSVIVPYFVPIIPAYLTYFHTIQQMNFPPWVAWTASFVVEVLGITAVSTAIRFYKNNQLYKLEKERAPFWLAIGVYAFYLVIVLSVNVILEIVTGSRSGWIIFSIGLFSLLSVPSGVLISIRSQYSEMLEERTIRKQERYSRHMPNFQQSGVGLQFNSDVKTEELKSGESRFRKPS